MEMVGAVFIASLKAAVIVTVSEATNILSASVSDKITETLELHTPHWGCLEVSEFQELVPALFLKLLGSVLI